MPVPLAFRMDIVLSWGVVIFGICVLRGSCLDQKTSERDIEGEFGISTETLNTPLKKIASTISSPKWHTYCRRSVDLSATFLTRNVNVTYIPAMAFAVWPETEVSQWWCHGKKICPFVKAPRPYTPLQTHTHPQWLPPQNGTIMLDFTYTPSSEQAVEQTVNNRVTAISVRIITTATLATLQHNCHIYPRKLQSYSLCNSIQITGPCILVI